jgi:hypothetical protein
LEISGIRSRKERKKGEKYKPAGLDEVSDFLYAVIRG